MGKKEKRPDPKRALIDTSNPFSSIVLREKKEEKKIEKSGKKPGEIVHGYNPSLSFADILSSYEKTGNPYSMPKKKTSPSQSFGDILEEWENGGRKDKNKNRKPAEREERASGYKPTRSFASILNDYEAGFRKKETREVKGKAKGEIDEALRSASSLDEEVEKAVKVTVSPSSMGNKKPENKTGEKKRQAETEDVFTQENAFFITDDEVTVPDDVSWSILGGKNSNYVRKEDENEEKKEDAEVKKRTSPSYTPSRSFADILYSFDKEKSKNVKMAEKVNEAPPVDDTPESLSDPFFIESEDEVPSAVSWSIIGGANKSFQRKEVEKPAEKKDEGKEKKTSPSYTPSHSFSSILDSYEKKKTGEKTFSEILREKGDNGKKKTAPTINELRRMDVQAILDLHGETQRESRDMISSFLSDSVRNGLRKVSIITGKGLHSEDGNSVLRNLTLEVLSSSPLVQEVSQAPLSKGGSGAVWIILRKNDE